MGFGSSFRKGSRARWFSLGSLLRFQRGGNVLRASREGLVLEEVGAWSRKRTSVPAQDLLGLEVGMFEELLRSAREEAVGKITRQGKDLPVAWHEGREPRWVAVLRRWVPSQGLLGKTRTGGVRFGGGLPDEELRYLRDLVLKALGTPPAS